MNTLKTLLSPILLSVLLAACESPMTNIPPSKLPQTESKLVVNSIISPHLPYINVMVTESIPLFSQPDVTEGRVENATVKISDGVNEMVIPYDAENKLYSVLQSKFPIKDLETYYLTVSDGTRSVTAQCTVPGKKPVIKSYEFDTLLIDGAYEQDTNLTVRMTWQDVPGDTNYYKVEAGIDLQYSAWGIEKGTNKIREEIFKQHFRFYWVGQEGRTELMSDKHLDGSVMNSLLGKFSYFGPTLVPVADGKKKTYYPKNKILGIVLEVLNIDVNYYKYQRSLEASANSDSNPFAEPAPLYSNVKGGLGCFAAYNAAQIKVSFP